MLARSCAPYTMCCTQIRREALNKSNTRGQATPQLRSREEKSDSSYIPLRSPNLCVSSVALAKEGGVNQCLLCSTLVSHRGHRIHWPVVAVFHHPTPLHTSPNGTAHHSEGLPSLSEATLVQGCNLIGKQTQRLRHTPPPLAASARHPRRTHNVPPAPKPANLPK